MGAQMEQDARAEHVWREFLTHGVTEDQRRLRILLKMLPGDPRCKNCYVPFRGAGSGFARAILRKYPSNLNPQLCNSCEEFARKYPGGAEVELSLLFADVRGSTNLAESMGTRQFSRLISRFYATATDVMGRSNALIDKIIGDQAAAMYVPGMAGPEHALRALEAGQEILRATGHSRSEGPWIPLGVGVHTGIAYVGAVGSRDGSIDITVLGDVANTAARLASAARVGEILISDAAYAAAGANYGSLETRSLDLKGKSQPVVVHVLAQETLISEAQ